MAVDFVINCYERTYRELTGLGVISSIVGQQQHGFDEVTLLVNNVNDYGDAADRAEQALNRGEISRYYFVRDEIEQALQITGLAARRIRRLPHFSDCCLVAVILPGPDWLVYWDADARLNVPGDWITPVHAYMECHPEILVGNPDNWHEGLSVREALYSDQPFVIGYGFSDVAYTARRDDMARPIYRKIAPASWRYPLSAVEPIFEQRVDAWMRRNGRMRATYLGSQVTHPESVGINYPTVSIRSRFVAKAHSVLGTIVEKSHHPAMRAWAPKE